MACNRMLLARNGSLSFNITLIEAISSPVTRYNCPYSGDVLEIIANLTWQKRALLQIS